MILLDTNVVSEAMTREPHPRVRAWLDAQAAETLFLSIITDRAFTRQMATSPRSPPRTGSPWRRATRVHSRPPA
jgi:predicted nucleic acid-binding protein